MFRGEYVVEVQKRIMLEMVLCIILTDESSLFLKVKMILINNNTKT